MNPSSFSICDKVLVLRYSRLGRLPPALYATEILAENGLPVLVLEFGNIKEEKSQIEEKPQRARWATPSAKLCPSPLRPVYILLATFTKLARNVQKEGAPRLTIGHGLQENFLAYALYLFFKIPYVIHVHEVFNANEISGWANKILFALEKATLQNAKFLLFPEEERRKLYIKRYALNCPTFLVPNCPRKMPLPKPQNLRGELKIPANSVLLGYVGGIGPDNLIEEAVKAIQPLFNVYFLLWGWGDAQYLNRITSLAKSLGMEKRVLLLGELKENKWNRLAGLDISYCVYRMDLLRMKLGVTASNKLFESMACKVPVIAPASFSFVEKNKLGVLVKSLSIEHIRDAVRRLTDDTALRQDLGNSARACFENTYYYEKQFLPALEAFKDLANENSPAQIAA